MFLMGVRDEAASPAGIPSPARLVFPHAIVTERNDKHAFLICESPLTSARHPYNPVVKIARPVVVRRDILYDDATFSIDISPAICSQINGCQPVAARLEIQPDVFLRQVQLPVSAFEGAFWRLWSLSINHAVPDARDLSW